MSNKPGPLIIISGPSGSGKSTLIRRVLAEGRLPLRLSVSATTRPPRPGERDGVEYHFWTEDRFRAAVAAGAFVEWAEVHGRLYGTPRDEVDPYRARGVGVILDIDVEGFTQVRTRYPERLSVFVCTPDEAFAERLKRRGTEDAAAIAHRVAAAGRELAHAGEYQHVLVNDDLEVAVRRLRDLIANQF
jgi:guanylate kinase